MTQRKVVTGFASVVGKVFCTPRLMFFCRFARGSDFQDGWSAFRLLSAEIPPVG